MTSSRWTQRAALLIPVVAVAGGVALSVTVFVISFFADSSRWLNSLYYLSSLLNWLGLAGLLLGRVRRSLLATWAQVACGASAVAFEIVAMVKMWVGSEYEVIETFRWSGQAGFVAFAALAFGFFARPLPGRLPFVGCVAFVVAALLGIVAANVDDAFRLPMWYSIAATPAVLAGAVLAPRWRGPLGEPQDRHGV